MRRALGIFAIAALAYAAPVAADITIGRDILRSGDVSPSSKLFELLLKSEDARNQLQIQNEKRAALKNKRFKRVVKKVQVKDVIKRAGNNPLNQQQPLNNTTLANGETVLVAADDLNQGGAGGGAGLAACIGQQVFAAPSPTAPPEIVFVNVRFDPATLDCSVAGGQSADGDFLIFQFGTNGGVVDAILVFADVLQPDWILISPPNRFLQFVAPNTTLTLTFENRSADNSVTIRTTVLVQTGGLTTTSITILNMEVL